MAKKMGRNVLLRGPRCGANVPKDTLSLEVSISFCSLSLMGILYSLNKGVRNSNLLLGWQRNKYATYLERGQPWRETPPNLPMLKTMGQWASETFTNQPASTSLKPNDLIWGPSTDWNGTTYYYWRRRNLWKHLICIWHPMRGQRGEGQGAVCRSSQSRYGFFGGHIWALDRNPGKTPWTGYIYSC